MSSFDSGVLDASIRDVVVDLSDIQKAEVLLLALQHSPTQGRRAVIESAVQSLLQFPNLSLTMVSSALLLRAKVRFAGGHCRSAQQDLQSALMADPENQDVKATIQSQHLRPEMPRKEADCPPRFSEEIWWQIALFLPKRDLRTLLFVPNALSRVASQLLFREVDLQLQTPSEGVDAEEVYAWDYGDDQRDADILTRILVDLHFASQIKTLNIFAGSYNSTPPKAFIVGMLMNALPKLPCLRKVHCSGDNKLISRVLQVVHLHNPRLQRLSLVVTDHLTDIQVPIFKHLTHFAVSSLRGSGSSLCMFLAQSRDNLRCLSIRHHRNFFPAQGVSIRHLTQIEFNDCFSSTNAFSEILENGHHLESLMVSGTLKCTISSLFRQHRTTLPSLRHFSFQITGYQRGIVDADLCPAVSDFVRERTQLRTYQFLISSGVSSYIGFDASAWSVLSGLSNLSSLSIMYPKDLPRSLAGWLVPRSIRALTLDLSLLNEGHIAFMNQLHSGIPPLLRYIAITNISNRSVRTIIEHGFPNIRVARIDETIWTVTRSGEGGALEAEEWPHRRVERYAGEWLDSLGCMDAVWEGVSGLQYT